MRSVGGRSREGIGSLLGCVFLLLIMLSGYLLLSAGMRIKSEYDEAVVTANALDHDRGQECAQVISLLRNGDGTLNITIANVGPIQVHLIWLGIFDLSANSQDYYPIDVTVAPTETKLIRSTAAVNEFHNYEIQLLTERGNIISEGYPLPFDSEWGTRAFIRIDGPSTIPKNTWVTYTVTVTTVTGEPFPYVVVYMRVTGSTANIQALQMGMYTVADKNGQCVVQIRSNTNGGETFRFYAAVGGVMAIKVITQEP